MNAEQATTGRLVGNRDRVPSGFQMCDHSCGQGYSQAGSSVRMQPPLQSQDAESGGRKNENRYELELVSAVKALHNPD